MQLEQLISKADMHYVDTANTNQQGFNLWATTPNTKKLGS